VVKVRVVAALAVLASGCDYLTSSFKTNEFSGDPYPIEVETSSGALVVGLAEDGRGGIRNAVLDVLSPITVVDRGADTQLSVDETSLTLYGITATGDFGEPRARVDDASVVTLHPCDLATEVCQIGSDTLPRSFDAVLGMDAFAGDALRIRRATNELFVFPDIAGDDLHRSRACDAVFPSTFRGGGTLMLGGTEVQFSNRRIAVDTCLAPNPTGATQRERGLDALLVLSTALGPTLLNEAIYARYQQLDATAPDVATLPEQIVNLPSGPIVGRLTSIPAIALVGNLPSNPRAPCRQVYAHHLLAAQNCGPGIDCPCADNETFCSVPAVVELAPTARLTVLIVSNDDPTLQALRTELRPDRPEVDGILGTDALQALELDVDYPHGRMLARCVDRQTCGARITLADHDSPAQERKNIAGCLRDEPGPFP
jgi:hypothetical protein